MIFHNVFIFSHTVGFFPNQDPDRYIDIYRDIYICVCERESEEREREEREVGKANREGKERCNLREKERDSKRKKWKNRVEIY